jgi:hypothetical protein
MNLSGPRTLLQLEGLAVLIASCFGYWTQRYPWGRFFLLFFVPDLLMVGYVLGPRVGAAMYNAGHSYVTPFLLCLVAAFGHEPVLFPFVLVWTAHLGFDRLLGYGLKYGTGFKDTHLGRV